MGRLDGCRPKAAGKCVGRISGSTSGTRAKIGREAADGLDDFRAVIG